MIFAERGEDIFVKLSADEGADIGFGIDREFFDQLLLVIEPRGSGLDLGEVEMGASGLDQIARRGHTQPLIDHHGQAALPRLCRAAALGHRNEAERCV